MEPNRQDLREAHGRWKRVIFLGLSLGALGLGPALGGCESSYTALGKSQIWAEYSFGVLAADFPERVRVPAVIAAADAGLRQRGYSVSSGKATAEEGNIHGEPPAAGGLDRVDVSARTIGEGTRVKVKVGMLGDEAQSRSVLEDVIRRLGL